MPEPERFGGQANTAKVVVHLSSAIFFIGGLAALIVSLLPYPVVKAIGDQLAPDKNMRSLTPERVALGHYPLMILGSLFLCCAVVFILRPEASRNMLQKALLRLFTNYRLFIQDARVVWIDVWASRPSPLETAALAVIVAAGAGLRVLLIDRPIEFDEAYTFIEFARHSFYQILTDYNVPNNHVFHTLLVRISYLLLGDSPWQLRLPSFLASLLLIVAVYYLGRNLYDRRAALLAAVLVAAIPILIFRSVAARGYIIVSLMVVLALLTADYVVRKKNSFAWFLLAFFCALGLYTIPVMIYPFGLIATWLFVTGLTRRIAPDYAGLVDWLRRLASFIFATAALAALFYAPILFNNDLLLVYKRNTVLQPESLASFLSAFPDTLNKMLTEWVAGIDVLLLLLLVLGLVLSVAMNRTLSKNRIALQLVFLAYIGVVILFLRPYPITRIWLWVTPLLALWSAAGLVGALHWWAQKRSGRWAADYVLAILVLAILANGAFASYTALQTQSIVEDPVVEAVTLRLRSLVTANDIVLVSNCAAPRYWYYFDLYQIPEETIRSVKSRPFKHAFVIAYTAQDAHGCKTETLPAVLERVGPSYNLFMLSSARILFKMDYVTVYEVDPYPELIKIFYPGQ